MSNLYGLATAGLVLLTQPTEAVTLADIVQADRIQNPSIVRVAQVPTSLESFLNAQYKIEEKGPIILRGSVKPELEIPHYHSTIGGVIGQGKLEFREKIYLESVLMYITANDSSGKKMHIISDFLPNFLLQYMVVLPEGVSSATVIDPERRFDEGHFKEKIRTYLEEEREKRKKSS